MPCGLLGKVKVFGFDGLPVAIKSIQDGELTATIKQDNKQMAQVIVHLLALAPLAVFFAPRWRITCVPTFARMWIVANHSLVRKLGAFHFTPSVMLGCAPRIDGAQVQREIWRSI